MIPMQKTLPEDFGFCIAGCVGPRVDELELGVKSVGYICGETFRTFRAYRGWDLGSMIATYPV